MKSGIYWIVGPTGKAYIGSSVNVERRLRQHRHRLKNGTHDNVHLQNAANKYGIERLLFHPLEYCTPDKLIEREQFHIDAQVFDTLYNLRPLAERTAAPSIETRAKISKVVRARHADPAYRKKLAQSAIKRCACPEWRAANLARMRAMGKNPQVRAKQITARLGNTVSEMTKAKLAEAQHANWQNPDYRARIGESLRKTLETTDARVKMSRAARLGASGYRGVTYDKRANKWQASTRRSGRTRSFGYYTTPELAFTWRLAMIAYQEYA